LLQWSETLFGRMEDASEPVPESSTGAPAAARHAAPAMAYRYSLRQGLRVPDRLRTERMPRDVTGLLDALVRNVRFTPEHLLTARQTAAPVERREGDLFDGAGQSRQIDQSAISDLFARQNAHELLRVSQYLDPAELGRRLQASLAHALEEAHQESIDERALRRALNVILVKFPQLLRDALRRAAGACTEVVDAADLPRVWESPVALTESPLNLYGRIPAGLNTWELRFADWLDAQKDRIFWWTRNLPRPNAADDWSVRIVLPESGRGFYPDFVICVEGRKQRDGIGLAETKERTETQENAVKSRTEHREYGRALMVSYDAQADRFIRVEFAPEFGRNRDVGPLDPDDLI
jgi:type III restriction enzyme